ncbi:MAG: biotin/lipoyl-binding protein [Planctomycetia bacterium]|nr:biotin/lipoyl-binding protein [Planctomycetia bacterium]
MNAPEQPSTTKPSLGDRVRSLRLGDRSAQPGSRLTGLPWVLVVVLLFLTALLGYRAYRITGSYDPERTASREPIRSASPVTTAGPTTPDTTPSKPTSSEEVILQSKGYVVPFSLIQVSPRVGGQLVEINENFREGERFKKGDFLARIDPKEYQYDYDQARAGYMASQKRYEDLVQNADEEIKQSQADLDEVKNNVQQMKLEMDRNTKLLRGSAVSQREMEQAQYNYLAMAARQRRLESALRMLTEPEGRQQLRIKAAKYDMEQGAARMATAKMRLDWTELRAPVDGIILSKKAELYNLVNPSAFSSGISASLCEMADLTRLEIDLAIQERDVALLRKGQECLVMPEAFQNDKTFLAKHPKGYQGYISRLMPTADRAKGAIPVRVWVKNITAEEAGVYLKPEMGALVSFLNRADPQAK